MKKLMIVASLVAALFLASAPVVKAEGWTDLVYYVERVSLINGVAFIEFENTRDTMSITGLEATAWAYMATQAMANNLPLQIWMDDNGQITGVRTWKP